MRCLWKITVVIVVFSAAFVLVILHGNAAERMKVSVASAPPGAAGYVVWGGLAALVTRESQKVEMSNLTTRGAVEDIRLIEAGKADFALGVATLVLRALEGKRPFKRKYSKVRGVGPGTVAMWHVVSYKRSGIQTVDQLKGKRLSFGPKGSSTNFTTKIMVKAAGIQVRPEYLNFNVAADAMKDNRIDAFTLTNPIPAPAVLKAATAAPINLLPTTGKVQEEFLKASRAFFRIDIPAGSYNGVAKNVPSVGFIGWTIAGADVPADVVYDVIRINYSKKGREYLPKVHKAWSFGLKVAPKLDSMAAIGLKLHPGAERYWKEMGHKIPAEIAN